MPYSNPEEQRFAQLQWLHRRKERLQTMLGGKCVRCDETNGLDFHHVDPSTKVFDICKHLSYAWPRLLVEVAKCELRCALHHTEFHAPPHGSYRKYYGGCRCPICKDGQARKIRKYRKFRKR